jgi:hypothetical protein
MELRNRRGGITAAEGCMFGAVVLFVLLLLAILYIAFMKFRNPPAPTPIPPAAPAAAAPAPSGALSAEVERAVSDLVVLARAATFVPDV